MTIRYVPFGHSKSILQHKISIVHYFHHATIRIYLLTPHLRTVGPRTANQSLSNVANVSLGAKFTPLFATDAVCLVGGCASLPRVQGRAANNPSEVADFSVIVKTDGSFAALLEGHRIGKIVEKLVEKLFKT